MANKVEQFPAEGRGRSALYPWDEWFDGSIWHLTREVDFKAAASAKNFRSTVKATAIRKGLKVKMSVVGENDLYLQAVGRRNGARDD